MADVGGAGASRGLSSISSEIGPPIFTTAPNGKAAAGAASGLLKTLFGVAPPNSHSTMISRSSFKDLNFVGGEEDAQDAWRDKWEAHKRSSLDLDGKLVGGSNPGGGGGGSAGSSGDTGGGAGGGLSRLGIPIPTKAGDVYTVAIGRGGAGASAGGRGSSSLGAGGMASTSTSPLSSLMNGAAAGARQMRLGDPSKTSSSWTGHMFGGSSPPGPRPSR